MIQIMLSSCRFRPYTHLRGASYLGLALVVGSILFQMASALDYGSKHLDPAYVANANGGEDVAVPLLQANMLLGGGDLRVTSTQRQLDRELVPLSRAAALSTAAYEEPTDPAELAQVSAFNT